MGMTGKSALVIGGTGATGKILLKELLYSTDFIRVGEFGRRITPMNQLPVGAKSKLVQKKVDFEKIDEKEWREGGWDVVFIALGTTLYNAGNLEKFKRIDHDYVVNAARAAKTNDPSHKQRIVYVSAVYARANAIFTYVRSKGQTELDLAKLGYSDMVALRPAFIQNAVREQWRIKEVILSFITLWLAWLTSSLGVDVQVLAQAMLVAGLYGSAALPKKSNSWILVDGTSPWTVVPNSGMLALSNMNL